MKRINLLIYITLIACISLISVRSSAQNLLTEGFEEATFPPPGWQNNLIDDEGSDLDATYETPPFYAVHVWQQAISGQTLDEGYDTSQGMEIYTSPYGPTTGQVNTGSQSAGFDSYDILNNGTADLVTPAIDLSAYPGGSNTVSFWYSIDRPDQDILNVYVSPDASAADGVQLASLMGTSYGGGMVQGTYTIPSTYTGTVYIIFEAVSEWGDNIYIDDVSVDHVGCSGAPSPASVSNTPLTSPACSGTTLTLNAADPNNGVPGILVYWQQATSATGPWVPVAGGTGNTSYSYVTPALTTSLYYRMVDTCAYSHISTPGDAFYVPVSQTTTITVQPVNTPACVNNDASITVGAVGASLTYQWLVDTGTGIFNNITNGGQYTNATTNTLNITGVTQSMSGYRYEVALNGVCGSQTSVAATLSVGPPPAIATQPQDSTICQTGKATFQVAATGISLSYQWQLNTGSGFANIGNGGVYSGQTSSTLVITNAPANMDGYQYRVIVSGACNPVISNPATIHVNALPTIIVQPSNALACNGSNATFVINAIGAGLQFQWQMDNGGGFNTISDGPLYNGTGTNTLTIIGASLSMSGYRYRAILSGICSPMDTTVTDTLKVNPLPFAAITFTDSTTICPSDSVFFTGNTGAGFTYHWYYNNAPIPGAIHDTLKANPAGAYKLAVTNSLGCTNFSNTDTVNYLPAPTSAITAVGPVAFCQGGSVTLNAITTTGVTYAWKLNGNYLSNDTTNTYTALASGSYTLYENNGTCGTVSPPVVVSATAIPQATITSTGSASTVCAGQTITLQATTGTGYTYQWQLNGTTQPSGTSSTFAAGQAGNYTVTVYSGPGCSATSSLFPISLLPSPASVITPAGSTSICPGSTAVLNANAVANATYQWNLNGTAISAATAPSYAAGTTGSYTLSVGASNGCAATSSPIVISSLPGVTAAIFSYGSDTICLPDSLTLTAGSAIGVSYTWYANGVAQADANNIFVVHNAGDYSVQVSNASCSATSTPVHVTTGATPTGSLTYSTPGSICGNNPVLIQAPTGTYTYQWYEDGVLLAGAYNQYYSASTPGSYTVVVSTALGCNYTPAAATVTVGNVPAPTITVSGNQLCTSGSDFVSYQWYFNSNAVTNATASCFNVTLAGGYSVVVTNVAGCSAMSDLYDAQNSTSVTNVVSAKDVKLYPNPTSAMIYIDAPVPVNISVMSIDGKILMHADKATSVNIGELASGMYMISVYDQDNHLLKTDKIVKS